MQAIRKSRLPVSAVSSGARFVVAFSLLLATALPAATPDIAPYATNVASLIAPAKLATLTSRGANPRIQKAVCVLAESAVAGCKPATVADRAVQLAGYTNRHAARLTKETLLRNLDIAKRLGCLGDAGLSEMRRGRSPTILHGPYKGQELTVDHIIPLAVAPEAGNVIANLELLPAKLNSAKRDTITTRQVDLAKKLRTAGLLSEEALQAVRAKAK